MKNWVAVAVMMFIGLFFLITMPIQSQVPTQLTTGTTERVSIASGGMQGNEDSVFPTISADGRYVAFHSWASNLVPGDTNGFWDVFVHDRQTGQTERVSIASDGAQSNDWSSSPTISADGRYVAFSSRASNLIPGDTNGYWDVFVHDRQTEQTERVSIASNGTQGNRDSGGPAISTDGRYVAFQSEANNLVTGDTNIYDLHEDIFVHDRMTGQTERVSIASDSTPGNNNSSSATISADGRYVAFESAASNLVPGDTSFIGDIFVHDRLTGQTEMVSVASDSTMANDASYVPAISANGRYVTFYSAASNLVPGDMTGGGTFVHDRQMGQTEVVSIAIDGTPVDSGVSFPTISADGRYVTFQSEANNLVSGDTNFDEDIFVHDRQTGQTERVSIASDGTQGILGSWIPTISADGRYVTFSSRASNLVPGDTNGYWDVFVHDRQGAPDSNMIYLPLVLSQ